MPPKPIPGFNTSYQGVPMGLYSVNVYLSSLSFFYNPTIHPTCLSPLLFLAPNTPFWSIQIPGHCELWPTKPSQLLQHLILYFYMQATPRHPSSAPTPELSPPALPSLCFPTWQIASLNSGWRALTRLQYKCFCRKWHQLRWRTKTLQLQSGSSSFCTEGVSHNPG